MIEPSSNNSTYLKKEEFHQEHKKQEQSGSWCSLKLHHIRLYDFYNKQFEPRNWGMVKAVLAFL